MACFADLPNELVLEVLEMVLPEDLENFVQMSKHVFLIARPVLESHRQLIRLHKRFFSSHLPPEQGLTLKTVMDFQLDPSQLYSQPYSMIVASVTILGKSY